MKIKIDHIAKIIFIVVPIFAILLKTFPAYNPLTSEMPYNLPEILDILLYYSIIFLAFLVYYPYIFIICSLVILYSLYSSENINKKNILVTIILLISGIITYLFSNIRVTSTFESFKITTTHIGIPFDSYKENLLGFSSTSIEFIYPNIIANILFYTIVLLYIRKIFIYLKKYPRVP